MASSFWLWSATSRTQAHRSRPCIKAKRRFRLLVEGVKDYAIFMLDPGGRVVSWNSGAERIKGYRAAEIVGRTFLEILFTGGHLRAASLISELETAASQGRLEDEGWRIRKDGSRFWANVVITAIRNENGNLRGFAKVTRDFTDRKNVE